MALRDVRMRLMGATQQNGYEKQAIASAAIGAISGVGSVLALVDGAWINAVLMGLSAYYMISFAVFLWNEKDRGGNRRVIADWDPPQGGVRLTRVKRDPVTRADAEVNRLLAQFEETLKEK